MNRKLVLAAAIVALAAPMAAQADEVSSTVNIGGNVQQACVIGQPTEVMLALGDLTGPDGRISTTLAGPAEASTVIETAWCNGPGKLSLDASPLRLVTLPGYGTPAGFARYVTYDAKLTGWTGDLSVRPLEGDTGVSQTSASAYANGLTLGVSRLAPLNANGTAAGLGTEVLEAGSYSGSVTVSIAVN